MCYRMLLEQADFNNYSTFVVLNEKGYPFAKSTPKVFCNLKYL